MNRVPSSTALLSIVLASTRLFAQLPAGSIGGTTTDASGSMLQGVHVIVTGERQGNTREAYTSAEGGFVLSDVAPGGYTLDLSAAGFATVHTHVQVDPGRSVTLRTILGVATQNSVVEVNSNTQQQVDLTQSMLQGQITAETIQSIPLNGRKLPRARLPASRQSPRAKLRSHQDQHCRDQLSRRLRQRRQHFD